MGMPTVLNSQNNTKPGWCEREFMHFYSADKLTLSPYSEHLLIILFFFKSNVFKH